MKCYLHKERTATRVLNVPCAPDGKLMACEECYKPEGRAAIFAKYQADHTTRVSEFRSQDRVRRAGRDN